MLIYRVVCECGKGYASPFDNLCRFCREKEFHRSEAKKLGVRNRGDGMSLNQAYGNPTTKESKNE